MSADRIRHFAIIPAAGRGHRMGAGSKLLLPWGSTTVLEAVLAAWDASRVERVIVIARREDVALHQRVVLQKKTSLVLPAENPPDMRASVEQGLRFARQHCAPASADRWMLAPADLPTLSTPLIEAVIAQAESFAQRIVLPRFADRAAHPVSVPWELAPRVFDLPPHRGVNGLKDTYPVHAFDANTLGLEEPADVDTPEDYRRLTAHSRHRPR